MAKSPYTSRADFFLFVTISGLIWDAGALVVALGQLLSTAVWLPLALLAGDGLWALLYLIGAALMLSNSGKKRRPALLCKLLLFSPWTIFSPSSSSCGFFSRGPREEC